MRFFKSRIEKDEIIDVLKINLASELIGGLLSVGSDINFLCNMLLKCFLSLNGVQSHSAWIVRRSNSKTQEQISKTSENILDVLLFFAGARHSRIEWIQH